MLSGPFYDNAHGATASMQHLGTVNPFRRKKFFDAENIV